MYRRCLRNKKLIKMDKKKLVTSILKSVGILTFIMFIAALFLFTADFILNLPNKHQIIIVILIFVSLMTFLGFVLAERFYKEEVKSR